LSVKLLGLLHNWLYGMHIDLVDGWMPTWEKVS
jgi:hypothetical protein